MVTDHFPQSDPATGSDVRPRSKTKERLEQLGLGSLAAVFDLIPCGLAVATDLSCTEVLHNRAATEFFRVRPGDTSYLAAMHPSPITVFHQGRRLTMEELPIQRAVWFGQSTTSEQFDIVWDDGVIKTALWSVEPLRDSQGELFGAVSTFHDLTEQRRVERERDGLQQRVQVHHQLLDGVMDHAPIGLCTLDSDLRVRWFNAAFRRLLNQPDQIIGEQYYAKLIANADGLGVLDAATRVLRTGVREDLTELSSASSDGQGVLFWNLTITPFQPEDNPDQPHVLLAMSDVTPNVLMKKELQQHRDRLAAKVAERTMELQSANQQLLLEVEHRRRIADELQKSSQKTIDILESISDAFLAIDRDFNITYVNHGAELHYRRTREELIGLNMGQLSPHFPQSEFKRQFILALEEQRPVHFEAFGNLSQRWMSMHLYPTADGLSVFFRDISNRRRASEAISRLASIVEDSDAAIIYLSQDGRMEAWNPGAERMFGYLAEEVVGQPMEILCPIELKDEPKRLMKMVSQGTKVVDFETVRRRKDGSLFNASLIASPVKNGQGEIIGTSSIVHDISERKRLEREFLRLDRLDLAAQLAAGIGHEIRNPMTTVRGFLQFLGMKPKFESEKEFFQLMIDELDRANSIITEFLALAKGKPVDRQMKSVSDIVRQLTPLIQTDVMLGGHELLLDLEDVPDLLLEEKDIRQMLLNLIRNGLEAMPGGGSLTVRTSAAANQVRLEVKDRGPGIAPEHINKIYVPFFTTKGAGTGLGLSVCYRIADQHGAKIEIDTGADGTTFAVVFPLGTRGQI